MFHVECIKNWFDNVQVTRDLTCPHCNAVITDSSEAPKTDFEHESDEVSASLGLDTPVQKLQQNQNMRTNNIALISYVENYLSKDTVRVDSDEHVNANPYKENELSRMYTEAAIPLHQENVIV